MADAPVGASAVERAIVLLKEHVTSCDQQANISVIEYDREEDCLCAITSGKVKVHHVATLVAELERLAADAVFWSAEEAQACSARHGVDVELLRRIEHDIRENIRRLQALSDVAPREGVDLEEAEKAARGIFAPDGRLHHFGTANLARAYLALRERVARLEHVERVLNDLLLAAYKNNASAYDERDAALAALRASAPVPGDERIEFFNWLNENPQAAAFTAVLVAKNRPHGPTLWATMVSGEVVGVIEDAKYPDYRYAHPTPETSA